MRPGRPPLLAGWFAAAGLSSVVAPAVVLGRYGRDSCVRRALAPYLGLLGGQIAAEAVLSRRGPRWLVLLTGTLFTAGRLRQLARSSAQLAQAPATPGRRTAALVVRAGQVFWTANLGVLAAAAPSRLRRDPNQLSAAAVTAARTA